MRLYLPALLLVPLLNGATADNLRTRTHPFNGSSKSDPSFLPADKIQKFNRMPPAIQAKIAEIFQEANIDAKVDGEYLDWDDDGQVLYADPPPPNDTDVDEFPIDDGTTKQYPEDAPVQASGVPIYHSKLGAPYTIYLDFDGHKFSGRAWNTAESFDMYPYNRGGGDPDTFTGEELDIIGKSWAVVAEDFAPFDVDVTTEEPPRDNASTADNWIFANTVGHVLVTAKTDRNGKTPYDCSCGGVAYVGVFGRSDYKNFYSPAFVFNTSFKGVAEAISHEFGHNLGLSHDGKGTVGYYTGHGPDGAETEWAPIMGVGYYAQIAQWSKGEYPDATQVQDDLAIIANKIPYRADDHTSEEPLIDGYAEGIIERNTDVDTFTFYGSGSTTVDIVTRSMDYGNLDAGLQILDNNGVVISGGQVETPNAKDASWTGTLAPGDYKIQVYGTGNGDDWITGYGDYGSLGQYEVYMTTEAGTLSPTKAPTPSPSAGPTKNPTLSPQIPTPSPTANPSMSPTTASPTKSLSPSKSPTGSPTKNPTTSPTDKPSKTPTVFPTNSPTDKPTSCNLRFQACPIVSSDPPCCNNSGCWTSGKRAGQCK